MGLPSTPSPPRLYPQALQLKLYQAFIFSVPILFSIILFLLFYLFYLKRRTSNLSSPPTLPWTLSQDTPPPFGANTKEDFKDQLLIIIFDEDLRSKNSQCCVCLGDFEIKEKLQQIPSCNHVFHTECIQHWLQANTTCPLCRGSIHLTIKSNLEPPVRFNLLQQMDANTEHHLQLGAPERGLVGVNSNDPNFLAEDRSRRFEGSTSAMTCLTGPGESQDSSVSMNNGMDYSHRDAIVVQISINTS